MSAEYFLCRNFVISTAGALGEHLIISIFHCQGFVEVHPLTCFEGNQINCPRGCLPLKNAYKSLIEGVKSIHNTGWSRGIMSRSQWGNFV